MGIQRGSSIEYPQLMYFMENWQKLFFNYCQLPTLSKLLIRPISRNSCDYMKNVLLFKISNLHLFVWGISLYFYARQNKINQLFIFTAGEV